MCSISGFFNPYADYSANQAEYQQILKQMTTVLFHRGPDECGFTLSKRCGLAHTRLSIIDLKTGSQPMVYETGGFSYQMIFNGEIYNLPDLKQQLASLGQCHFPDRIIFLCMLTAGIIKSLFGKAIGLFQFQQKFFCPVHPMVFT